jgi:hypothetical protein
MIAPAAWMVLLSQHAPPTQQVRSRKTWILAQQRPPLQWLEGEQVVLQPCVQSLRACSRRYVMQLLIGALLA